MVGDGINRTRWASYMRDIVRCGSPRSTLTRREKGPFEQLDHVQANREKGSQARRLVADGRVLLHVSVRQRLNHGLKCFASVEQQLYDSFGRYQRSSSSFTDAANVQCSRPG